MTKRVSSSLDWCHALAASDLVYLQRLCESPEARECVNDTYTIQNFEARFPSPLMYAISTDVPLGRIRLLVDHGGAHVGTASLHCTINDRRTQVAELLNFLLSRGAKHEYYTFRRHVSIVPTEEERVALFQRYPQFATELEESTIYAHTIVLARQRMQSARATATALLSVRNPWLNKDMLRVVARLVLQKAASPAWKQPPMPWWKILLPPPPDSIGSFILSICMAIIAMHGMFCLLTGSSDFQCSAFWW